MYILILRRRVVRKANLSHVWLVIPPALHGEFLMVLRPLGGQYQRQGAI